MPSVSWGGEDLPIKTTPSTGDLYHWRVVLMGNLFADITDGSAIVDAVEFCARFLDCAPERLIELCTVEANDNARTIWNLGELLFDATSYRRNAAVRDAMRIQFGVVDYKPGSNARVCDCRACSGILEDGKPVAVDPLCQFTSRGVGPIDRDVAGLDAKLIADFWDRPHYLYRLACFEKEFSALSVHKRGDAGATSHGHGQSEQTIRQRQRARLRSHLKR